MQDPTALKRLRWRITGGLALTQVFAAIGSVLPGGLPSDGVYSCAVILAVGIAVWAIHWAECSRVVKNLIFCAVVFVLLSQALEITDNFDSLGDVPVLGHDSFWNGRLSSLGLITGILFMFAALLFALVETRLGRVAHERYRLLAENISDVIFIAGLDFRPTYISPSITRLRGFTVEEALAQPPEENMTPQSILNAHNLLEDNLQCFREGRGEPDRVAAVEMEVYRKDGSTVWVEMGVRFLFDKHGSPTGILGVVRDISERKRAEDAARQLTERLTMAIQAGNLGVWDWDATTGSLVWDERMYEIYGVDSSPGTEAYEAWRTLIIPENLELAERDLLAVITGHGEFKSQCRVLHGDGSLHYVESRAVVRRDEQGKALRVIGMSADITEQVETEAEHARLQEQLSQAQKMESVGRLAGGVAHDFNNMLLVILGHTELASATSGENEELRQHLEEIRSAAMRSVDLTRQLLTFARRQSVTPCVIDLNLATSGMFSMLGRLIGEGIQLSWKPGDALWHVLLDPSQADQILANLCVNARDAIGGIGELGGVGEIEIRTCNVTLEAGAHPEVAEFKAGEYVRLVVSDNGCGMSQEMLGNIFEPFYTTKAPGTGTGLGLSTVYGIVRQNGGFITATSEVGRGTTFTIDLPRHQGLLAPVVPVVHCDSTALSGKEVVLVVEDEAAILELATNMLGRLGYTVIAAATPAEALRLAGLSTEPIQLLLTDIVMPEMNGRDLAATLLARNHGMKLIYMSGYTADIISQDEILREGANFIQKPFSAKALAARVRETLDQ